ncbi:hypothetical protein MLD38_029653 [Melastoma candidum]|uniref:Uncharacterized protein n=1 Tax=Melastoma candidum TaxID=119954 RepID=A0ACB9N4H3_9MYRT|nr:hypothetical protein MLD38_029653 [Melastoma candidum]
MLSRAQSPARFGLNSPPKPPPQQQLPPQQQQPSAAAAATTTTSNLLSLLPPLPRSQSFLSLLSQLTTNLFLLSPSPSFRLNPPSFLPQSPNPSPSPNPNPSPSSVKETLALLSSIQSQLFASVSELQDILDLHDAAAAHSRSLSSLSSTSLSFSLSLLQPYSNLRSILHDYSSHSASDRSDRVALNDVISYAHRISYTTFAPPEFGAGTAPLRGALPPAPQDEQMRASQLYAFADLDVGVPRETKDEAEGVERVGVAAGIPTAEGVRAFDDVSSMIRNLKVPEGWKPGMPVELPEELPEELRLTLPIPPSGWKPGELPAKGMDAAVAAQQQQQPQQVNNVMPNNNNIGREPGTIQVRHVELDLPDSFDDSSDYSSEEGSSDEED